MPKEVSDMLKNNGTWKGNKKLIYEIAHSSYNSHFTFTFCILALHLIFIELIHCFLI